MKNRFCLISIFLLLGTNMILAQLSIKSRTIIKSNKSIDTVYSRIQINNERFWRLIEYDNDQINGTDTFKTKWIKFDRNADSIYVKYSKDESNLLDSFNLVKFKAGEEYLSSDIFNFGNSFIHVKTIKFKESKYRGRQCYYFKLKFKKGLGGYITNILMIDKELLIPIYQKLFRNNGKLAHNINYVFTIF